MYHSYTYSTFLYIIYKPIFWSAHKPENLKNLSDSNWLDNRILLLYLTCLPAEMALCCGMSMAISLRLCTYLTESTTGINTFRPYSETISYVSFRVPTLVLFYSKIRCVVSCPCPSAKFPCALIQNQHCNCLQCYGGFSSGYLQSVTHNHN